MEIRIGINQKASRSFAQQQLVQDSISPLLLCRSLRMNKGSYSPFRQRIVLLGNIEHSYAQRIHLDRNLSTAMAAF